MFVNLVVIWVWNAKYGIICLCVLPIMIINGGNSHNVKVFPCEILHCAGRHARLAHLFLLTCVYFQPPGAGVHPHKRSQEGLALPKMGRYFQGFQGSSKILVNCLTC